MDNVFLPLAVIVLCIALTTLGADPGQMIRRICLIVVVAMLFNTVAALAQAQGLISWDQWWTSGAGSVADRAEGNGRFSGIINQPSEGGALYGIALLAAIHRWPSRPVLLTFALLALTVGGMLTVSKVFLLVGLPIAAIQLITIGRARMARLVILTFGLFTIWLTAQVGALPEWAGASQLRAIQPSGGQSLLEALSAGRFGTDSSLRPIVEATLQQSPLVGFGAGGLDAAYDNAWVEALVISGIVGFACYTIILITLLAASARSRIPLFWGLMLLIIGGSLGVPMLTANRVAAVSWMLVTLLTLQGAKAGLGLDTLQPCDPSSEELIASTRLRGLVTPALPGVRLRQRSSDHSIDP